MGELITEFGIGNGISIIIFGGIVASLPGAVMSLFSGPSISSNVIGIVLFLWPMSFVIMWMSWPLFVDSLARHEVSSNAGGLLIWPARLMMPIGFALLIMQSVSELIKRIAFLRGRIPDPLQKHGGKSAEEELAEEIARQRGMDSPALDGKNP